MQCCLHLAWDSLIFLTKNHISGYKPSDKNTTDPSPPEQSADLTTTAKTPVEEDQYQDLDSLTAPVPSKPKPAFKKFPKLRNKTRRPLPPPPPPRPTPTTTAPSPPTSTTTAPTTTVTSTPSPTTTTATTTTTGAPAASPRQEVTYPAPIQALVQEYQERGHVVEQPEYPEPVLQAIKNNFEHKKNIFEQFVTFDENDKAFIPNKEVVHSDWTIEDAPAPPQLSDKILVYQTLPPSPSPAPASTVSPIRTSAEEGIRRQSSPTFPNERNAEGGFRPMIRPLHSPLLNQ